jgi:benzoate/toluate 1,2-dioxygenase beta subunit
MDAAAFLIHEARLLDAGRYDEWLALFADDGFYWIPARRDQTDPWTHFSILHEDPSVLRMRVRRLAHARIHAADPPPRTAHIVGNVTVADCRGDADCEARSSLMVAEYRAGDCRLWAGQCLHRLRRADGGFRIVLKRIDLIDADAPHEVVSAIL